MDLVEAQSALLVDELSDAVLRLKEGKVAPRHLFEVGPYLIGVAEGCGHHKDIALFVRAAQAVYVGARAFRIVEDEMKFVNYHLLSGDVGIF